MTLPSLSTVGAMEVRLGLPVGSLAGADLARAETSLADASALVRSVGDRAWVDAEGNADAPDDVVMVVTRAAIRDYRNPDGVMNEALGAGAYAYTYAEGEASIFLTDQEVAVVKAAAVGGPVGKWSGTGSVRTPSAYAACERPTDRDFWGL